MECGSSTYYMMGEHPSTQGLQASKGPIIMFCTFKAVQCVDYYLMFVLPAFVGWREQGTKKRKTQTRTTHKKYRGGDWLGCWLEGWSRFHDNNRISFLSPASTAT